MMLLSLVFPLLFILSVRAQSNGSSDKLIVQRSNRNARSRSTPVKATKFLQTTQSLPMEIRDIIMTGPWKSSRLAVMPAEMQPLLWSVQHVVVDKVPAFAAVFKALRNLRTIDITAMDLKGKYKYCILQIARMLVQIMKEPAGARPPTILGLKRLFNAAIYSREIEVLRLILSTPQLQALVDPAENGNQAIISAAHSGLDKVVEVLLTDPRVDPSARNNEAIRNAPRADVAKLLLKDPRVDPSARNNEAIRWASEKGFGKVIEVLLVDPRVDPTVLNNEPIRKASLNGHTGAMKLLLKDSRVDPSARNNEALILTSLKGHYYAVKLLLKDRRVDPTAQNYLAFRLARAYGHTDVVELFLAHARVNASEAIATPQIPILLFSKNTYRLTSDTLRFMSYAEAIFQATIPDVFRHGILSDPLILRERLVVSMRAFAANVAAGRVLGDVVAAARAFIHNANSLALLDSFLGSAQPVGGQGAAPRHLINNNMMESMRELVANMAAVRGGGDLAAAARATVQAAALAAAPRNLINNNMIESMRALVANMAAARGEVDLAAAARATVQAAAQAAAPRNLTNNNIV